MNTKSLTVSFLGRLNYYTDTSTVSEALDMLPQHGITNIAWTPPGNVPIVSFMIAYGEDCIFLKFVVTENEIRAVNTLPHSRVWEDSCVEMFIRFRDDGGYYNFEINCLGTMLLAYGPNRENRTFLPLNVLTTIRRTTLIARSSESGSIEWEMLLVIPFTAFIHDNISNLRACRARANFFKCGDKLSEPHYLSWAPVDSATPDFHLPQFFGRLEFNQL